MSAGRATTDVAIVGAGPYGLSLATQLVDHHVEHRIFGHPMQTWRRMPAGMYLKSLGFATNIYTPRHYLTLPEFCRERGLEDYEPIQFSTFADYGVWMQQKLVPHLEETGVELLAREQGSFALTLETGERLLAKRVVVAVGLTYFARLPEVLSGIPRELVAHTSRPFEFSRFNGADVTVVGGGSSALEAAALLHENGAHVRLLARSNISWGQRGPRDGERSLLDRLRLPNSVVGHGRGNWALQHLPMWMHYLSAERRLRALRTSYGPSGAWWLRARVADRFPLDEHTSVVAATVEGGRVSLGVKDADGGERTVRTDFVVAGTGYEVDLDRLAFMDAGLRRDLDRIERSPRLSRHFESSVPGLYFIGPASAASFGPLFRFVAGGAYTVPVVARHLARRSHRPRFAVRQRPATGARVFPEDVARR
jgi:thioredoxin reductase